MSRRILVAVNGSSTADAALREALDLARDTHGHLRIVHVIDSPYDYPDVMFVHVAGDMEDLREACRRRGERCSIRLSRSRANSEP